MGLLDNLERRIEKAVRKPFAGRGGDLQPVELASALRNAVDRRIVSRKNRTISPNTAAFRFGAEAYEKAREWGSPLAEELCDVLIRHARTQGYTLPSDVQVTFLRDESLPPHEFEVDPAFIDDDGTELFATEAPPSRRHSQRGSSPQDGFEEDYAPSSPSESAAEQAHAPQQSAAPAHAAPHAPSQHSAPGRQGSPATSRPTAARLLEPEPPALLGIIGVEGQRYAIEGASVILGRSHTADITVADDGVSRRHLEIFVRDGGYWARDLGSTNGTHLNGFPLEQETELTDGSLLTMAATRVSFRLAPREAYPNQQPSSRFSPDSLEASP
ncbi:DUF3662 and FHA domain-containing protein [Falsarthrobacter nasiphocae]|uniref:FHA domain-containing protein n=1 Tax=Falsarthrobacter nasiphocae TaxID=189863 RepID=A0AAE3YH01_9MICC|nr:DUF3662 and FHA domain-containing protein [Falsarthrobacter nasiphocae]MDR6892039.1 hypothetical protein [Falsarthrobacter nasiphocae]